MRSLQNIIYVLIFVTLTLPLNAQDKIKTRSESFWGVHFDRHSQLTDEHLGKTLT